MAKKPTLKHKSMTKLERRIHNEKILLGANYCSNGSVVSIFGGYIAIMVTLIVFPEEAQQAQRMSLYIMTGFLVICGSALLYAGELMLNKLIEE